jgi:hypothetical protein
VTCLRLIQDEPSVHCHRWAGGMSPLSQMRCPMCTDPGGLTVACLQIIRVEPSVQDHWWEEGSWPLTHMRCPVCTDLGGQTDGGLPPANLKRAVCPKPRGWLASDSYEVPQMYRCRWTDGGLPPAKLGRAVCPRPLMGRSGWPLTHMGCVKCTDPGRLTVACLRLNWVEPSVQDH